MLTEFSRLAPRVAPGTHLALAVGLLLGASANAQPPSLGIGVTAAALANANRLGGGAVVGVGPSLSLPVGTWTALEPTVLFFSTSSTTTGDPRRYTLVLPELALRGTLIEGPASLSFLLGGGAMLYHLHAATSTPRSAERTVPGLGPGLGIRMRLIDRIAVDLAARDWLTYARTNEFGQIPGHSGIGQTLDVRATLSLMVGARRPKLNALEDTPLTYNTNFRPVEAAAVTFDPASTDDGRTHMHASDGSAVALAVVPRDQFQGASAPGSLATLVAMGPAVVFDERILAFVYFQVDSDAVDHSYRLDLENVASYLGRVPLATLELRGYTDKQGPAFSNVALAERRTSALKDLLVRVYGVAPDRIRTVSVGVDFRSATDPEARRVEIRARSPRVTEARNVAGDTSRVHVEPRP